jgi:hypothetical protein
VQWRSLKRFAYALVIFCGSLLGVGVESAHATTTTYTASFTSGAQSSSTAISDWNIFVSSLTGTYTAVKISSSLGPSITLTHATLVQTVANNLKNSTASNTTIGSSIVSIGNCGSGIEITIGPNNSTCQCASTGYYTLRPLIQASNPNWGGADSGTCNAATQTLTLSFYIQGPGVTSFAPTVTTSNSTTLTYNLVFNVSVTGLVTGDFAKAGTGSSTCAIGSPSGSGTTYQIILTGCSPGTVILTLLASSVIDGSSNTGPGTDTAAATVTVSQPVTVTLTIVGGNTVVFNAPVTVKATVNAIGKVTFYANGKKIPKCAPVIITGVATEANCQWKPNVRSQISLYAIDVPSVANYITGQSPAIVAFVKPRVGTR